MHETLFRQRWPLNTLALPRILQLQLYLALPVFQAEWIMRSAPRNLDIYIDCFGYLPESLVENMAALREMYPGRRHVLIYQLLIVDGIPEAQIPLQVSLAKWDKVLIVSYQSPSPLLVSAEDNYLIDLAATLQEIGVDATFIGPLENGLTVLPDMMKAGDILFFSVHPRSEDLAWRIAYHTSTHENTHHQQHSCKAGR